MAKRNRVISLFIFLAATPPVSRGAVMNRMIFETSSGDRYVGSSSATYELNIDDSVEIRIDEKSLLGDIRWSSSPALPGQSLLSRIQFLHQAVDAFVVTQEGLLGLKAAGVVLEAAKGSDAETDARKSFQLANSSFSDAAVSALSSLNESLDSDSELKASLEPALNEAVLGDYGQMADVLRRYLSEIDQKLGKKAENAQRLEVTLEAFITGGLRKQRIHLDGYDDIRTGEPVPFPRFQLALDERAKEEFAASEKLSESVNRILNGSFEKELKASIKKVETALRELARTVKTDVLEAELNDTLKTLVSVRDENLAPVISEVVAVRDLISGLDKLPPLSDETRLDALLSIAGAIAAKASQLQALANSGPERLAKLTNTLERLAREKPNLVNKKIQQTVLVAKDNLTRELAPLKASYTNLLEIAKAIGMTADVAAAADSVASRPRELGIGNSLDSRFDLQTIKDWQRNPGDEVSVSIRVSQKGTDDAKAASLAFGRQRFRLEALGAYLQSRAALLFVDSRTGKVPKQSFETVPGAAFHLRYGWKNQNWWNEWLAPGVGMSLAMLNFDSNKNFELGIAGSVTLIRDMFWVGYGRNLQAQADYFFVGINPIALGALYRQKAQ